MEGGESFAAKKTIDRLEEAIALLAISKNVNWKYLKGN